MKQLLSYFRRQEQGQSLAEAALILPVLIILIAGVVEVSHMAVTQSRVTTAARNGARFGANGGEDTGMIETTLNTAIETVGDEQSEWDIWVIRATVDGFGNIPPDNFSFTHEYGLGQTARFTDTNTITFTNELRQRIEAQLQMDESSLPGADPSGLRVVGIYSLYDIDSIIGLNILPNLAGLRSMKGYSVMRQASLAAAVNLTSGCNGVFPMMVDELNRSLTQIGYEILYEPSFTYPTGSDIPRWEDFGMPTASTDVGLLEGREGYVYGFNFAQPPVSQNLNFLRWNDTIQGVGSGGSILNASLMWPGNNDLYDYQSGDSPFPNAFRGYAEPGDPTDTSMHFGDWVLREGLDFSASGVQATLNDHIDSQRALRVVLWNSASGEYNGTSTKISGFAIFRIVGYQTNGWMLLELVRIDRSCGQSLN